MKKGYKYKPTKQSWSGGKRSSHAGTGRKYVYVVVQGKKRYGETDIFHAKSTAEHLAWLHPKQPVRILREIGVVTKEKRHKKKVK